MIIKTIVLAVLLYLVWAILHHKKDKSLSLNVLLEYLLTAVLALVLILAVTNP